MLPLFERAQKFEKYLDSVIDKDGLVYSSIKADEFRPWRNEDFEGFEIWDHFKDDFAGYMNYENSIMSTGRYISVKVLKHLNSEDGDKNAINDAERSIKALLALSREGDKIEKGYLPKPHGGLKNASKSLNISTDQYTRALFAFWRFRKACPHSPLIPKIESAIISWIDYFIRHDFKFIYFQLMEVIPERAIHVLGLFIPALIMAGEITGDRKYIKTLNRRIVPLLRGEDFKKQAFYGKPNVSNLTSMGLHFAIKKGYIVEECKKGMKLWWENDKKYISSDGLAYQFPGITDDNQIEPHWSDRVDKLGWRWRLWRSNMKSADSCKTAHTGALYERTFPGEGAAEISRRILNHFEKPQDFLNIDIDGKQIPNEYSYFKNAISSQFIGAWLGAYYLLEVSREIDGL